MSKKLNKIKSSDTFKRYLKGYEKLPDVKRELKDMKSHFKIDAWPLDFAIYNEMFSRAGAHFIPELLYMHGFRVRQNTRTGELHIVKRSTK